MLTSITVSISKRATRFVISRAAPAPSPASDHCALKNSANFFYFFSLSARLSKSEKRLSMSATLGAFIARRGDPLPAWRYTSMDASPAPRGKSGRRMRGILFLPLGHKKRKPRRDLNHLLRFATASLGHPSSSARRFSRCRAPDFARKKYRKKKKGTCNGPPDEVHLSKESTDASIIGAVSPRAGETHPR